MKFATIENRFPIIHVKMNPVNSSEEELNEFLAEAEMTLKSIQERKAIFICDLTQITLSTELRAKQKNWTNQKEKLIKDKVLSFITINRSGFSNVLFKSMLLFKKSPVPFMIVTSLEDAMRIAYEQLIIF